MDFGLLNNITYDREPFNKPSAAHENATNLIEDEKADQIIMILDLNSDITNGSLPKTKEVHNQK